MPAATTLPSATLPQSVFPPQNVPVIPPNATSSPLATAVSGTPAVQDKTKTVEIPGTFAGVAYSPLLQPKVAAPELQPIGVVPMTGTPSPSTEPAPAPIAPAEEESTIPPSPPLLLLLHGILSLLLTFEGLIGMYSLIRFVAFDFPSFEQSFSEFGYAEGVLNQFIQKAGMLTLGTAISLFVVVHTNIFHRHKLTGTILFITLAVTVIVAGLLVRALTIMS